MPRSMTELKIFGTVGSDHLRTFIGAEPAVQTGTSNIVCDYRARAMAVNSQADSARPLFRLSHSMQADYAVAVTERSRSRPPN
jgi:hypothetical protein